MTQMTLRRLRIENYRNFTAFVLEFEPDCTVLIGENNSGKTNVLAALYANLRANRAVREGAFDIHDFHLARDISLAGEAGPITLTVTFEERTEDEWDLEVVSLLEEVINLDPTTGLRSIVIRVTGTPSTSTSDSTYEWSFLNAAGVPTTQKNLGALGRLQSLRPLFMLDALRDSAREFSQRSAYFGAFTRDPHFDEAVRERLVDALREINDQVLTAHAVFDVLRTNLDESHGIVHSTGVSSATIEAVPSRISDLLENAQVSFQNRHGVALPLERHGSGTQSLAVLSLFRAYVEAKLISKGEPLSSPILCLEEPETHLHPAGARALWGLVDKIPGQKIVTTHSGDFVGEAPLRCLRRLYANESGVLCRSVDESGFEQRELEHLNFYIRLNRGELLFANCWLLVEGKSEMLLLTGIARAANIDLYANGIRVVEHSQHGKVRPFIKLADQLGINWHSLSDNDDAGRDYATLARSLLNGRRESEYITVLDHGKLETFLCKNGFVEEYLAGVPTASQSLITAARGTDQHIEQVIEHLPDTQKVPCLMRVCERITANPALLPTQLRAVIDACIGKVA